MTAKNARLDIKTTEEAKALLEKAAHTLGTTLSAFMIDSGIVRARKILEQSAAIQLNAEEAENFLKALESPPLPNKKLKELFLKHHSPQE
jgi:uncharacterized protein (DUF1778 family)